jgi:large subunit ribosomal protein L22
MVSRAVLRYVRISPRKIRQVINIIRGQDAEHALALLANMNRAAAVPTGKVIKSALSNARSNPQYKGRNLYISKIVADDGPSWKRFKAGAMGRAMPILKRTAHITVELNAPT